MFSLFLFLVLLSVLVTIHELGHFVAARLLGVKVEEFGFGFPPRLMGFVKIKGKWKMVGANDQTKRTNTIWSVNWLPLGGFVRLKGEQESPNVDEPDTFAAQKPWKRLVILLAGVCMNWCLAACILSVGFMIGVPTSLHDVPAGAVVQQAHVEIEQVVDGSSAAKAGIQTGDQLQSVNGQSVQTSNEAQHLLQEAGTLTQPAMFRVLRGTQSMDLSLTPQYVPQLGHPGFGVAMDDIGIVRFGPINAVVQGVVAAWRFTQLICSSLWSLVSTLVVHQRLNQDVSGPVGIAVMSAQVVRLGWWSFMQFAALLSLNLAIVNVLPIPALDGGRVIFVLIELVRRKKVSVRIEDLFHRVGFGLLLTMIILVTLKDLHQYGGMILHYFVR